MTTIERIARLLAKDEFPQLSQEWHDEAWTEWLPLTRAVLQAIREPTDAMLQAADNVEYAPWSSGWAAMIDAALDERS